ncbi:carbon storage regulator CsrA [Paenisporosarcina cavernae]|uniref:Translational regulator CsrA n=1 Tax=Paenisporosarcina cavernae TaxID=2320858 RepID=A0A385YQD7_9BACL|nr:carbon storage regulator CsrA [Paenisporosarcina cavernae]AYC28945.1 carbon storage regulator [Paenisporosarcina cavernae]
MLVLTRKKDESIIIGDNIELKILNIEGESVKVGIVAPSSIKIYRSEIYQSITEQNREVLSVSKDLLEIIKKKK